jgi:protein-disulfide isomerase
MKAPDVSGILFIQNLQRIGATLYYMGESMGLHGWLVIKDKQMQIVYTTPDQRAVVVGALLSAEGANISQQQMLLLANNHPEVADVLKAGQGATVQVAEDKKADMAAKAGSPSENFYAALLTSTQVTFGKPDAPRLMMLMDVNCPHCHNAWKKLEKYVDGGTLRLSMIPINALGPQSEVEAANWLNKKDPLDAWKKHVGGDTQILKIGDADLDKGDAIFKNTQLARKWRVDQTPYLVYRGKNGKIRLVVGEPTDVEALVGDVQ